MNGQDVRTIEFLEDPYTDDVPIEAGFFVDSGLSYQGAPTTTISGLDHLEGETVALLVDGATHPDRVVSGGSVTLEREGSQVHAGLAYEPAIETLRLNPPDPLGSSQGKLKRVPHIVFRLHRSGEGIVVSDPDDANVASQLLEFRDPDDPMDSPPPLFSGDAVLSYEGGSSREARVRIAQPHPLPFTLVALMPQVDAAVRT